MPVTEPPPDPPPPPLPKPVPEAVLLGDAKAMTRPSLDCHNWAPVTLYAVDLTVNEKDLPAPLLALLFLVSA